MSNSKASDEGCSEKLLTPLVSWIRAVDDTFDNTGVSIIGSDDFMSTVCKLTDLDVNSDDHVDVNPELNEYTAVWDGGDVFHDSYEELG
jgi:hypothetical protein